jgi:hypothetical protein
MLTIKYKRTVQTHHNPDKQCKKAVQSITATFD